jgi:hypothetical protein
MNFLEILSMVELSRLQTISLTTQLTSLQETGAEVV